MGGGGKDGVGQARGRGGGIIFVFELKFISFLEGKGWVCWGVKRGGGCILHFGLFIRVLQVLGFTEKERWGHDCRYFCCCLVCYDFQFNVQLSAQCYRVSTRQRDKNNDHTNEW